MKTPTITIEKRGKNGYEVRFKAISTEGTKINDVLYKNRATETETEKLKIEYADSKTKWKYSLFRKITNDPRTADALLKKLAADRAELEISARTPALEDLTGTTTLQEILNLNL